MFNLNKKLNQILGNMDPQALQKGFKAVSDLMNTEEGKKLAEQLKNIDKEKLIQQMQNIDESQLVQKLDQVDVNQLSSQVSDIDKDKILKDLASNPEFMKRINDIMNQK